MKFPCKTYPPPCLWWNLNLRFVHLACLLANEAHRRGSRGLGQTQGFGKKSMDLGGDHGATSPCRSGCAGGSFGKSELWEFFPQAPQLSSLISLLAPGARCTSVTARCRAESCGKGRRWGWLVLGGADAIFHSKCSVFFCKQKVEIDGKQELIQWFKHV